VRVTQRAKKKDGKNKELECGPMSKAMGSPPNTGGTLCEGFCNSIPCTTLQTLADAICSSVVQFREIQMGRPYFGTT